MLLKKPGLHFRPTNPWQLHPLSAFFDRKGNSQTQHLHLKHFKRLSFPLSEPSLPILASVQWVKK